MYSLFGVLTINILIALRYVLHDISGSKSYTEQANIPIEYLIYFLMATDAEKRERDSMKAQTYMSLFKTCAFLAAYSLLNDSTFQI